MTKKHLAQLILSVYDTTIDVIVIGLVLMMLVVLVFAFVDVLVTLLHLIPTLHSMGLDAGDFRDMVTMCAGCVRYHRTFQHFHRIRQGAANPFVAVDRCDCRVRST